jgi:hypothetical protein
MIVRCAATIRALLDVDIEQCHRKKDLIAPQLCSLAPFVTNAQAIESVVNNGRKTAFVEGRNGEFGEAAVRN